MGERLEIVISATDRASGVLNGVGLAIAHQKRDLEGLNIVAERFEATGRRQMIAGAALGVGLAASLRPTMEFEQGMRDVNSVLQLNEGGYQSLRREVLALTNDPGITDLPDKLAKGLYDVSSAGLQGAEAMGTLRVASRLATAGLTDTNTATNVLVTAMMAYGRTTAKDALDISDTLATVVKGARGRLAELAEALPIAIAPAAKAGIPLQELAAAFGTMRMQGFDAALSGTALMRVMTSMMNPSKELKRIIQDYGYESGLQIMRNKGLAGTIEWLTEATRGQEDVMVQVVGEQRAIRAVMALTGTGAEILAKQQQNMGKRFGETGRMVNEQMKGPMQQYRKAIQEIHVAWEGFATQALPIVSKALHEVGIVAKRLESLPDWMKKAGVTGAIGAVGVLIFSGAVNLIIGGALRAYLNIKTLIGGMNALSVAGETAAAAGGGGGLLGRILGGTSGSIIGKGGGLLQSAKKAVSEYWDYIATMGSRKSKVQEALAVSRTEGSAWRPFMTDYVRGTDAAKLRGLKDQLANSGIKGMWKDAWKAADAGGGGIMRMLKGIGEGAKGAGGWFKRLWSDQAGGWGMSAGLAAKQGSPILRMMQALKGGAIGVGGSFKSAFAAVLNFGKAGLSFLVSPAGIAIAAIAAVSYELYKLYGVFQEWRQAAADAKANEKAAKDMEKGDLKAGYVTYGQMARRMGLEKEYEAGTLTAEQQKQIRDQYNQQAGARSQARDLQNRVGTATSAQGREEQLAAAQAQWGEQAQAAANYDAASLQGRRQSYQNGRNVPGYGTPFQLTVYANSPEDMKRIACEQVDNAFQK